ncbi:bis(5'-nucleosyl)-tetraphosphatase (symmetrical) YqeK [Enterococcus sp. AD013-P3]|uniref:bis(5'-nucleosyl)-tetraphosphatase (symmetrical) YqeK n=1 Tax=Enterococcus sp. AD013-P3 TaxID=3411036 RepID=UPI003B92BBA8
MLKETYLILPVGKTLEEQVTNYLSLFNKEYLLNHLTEVADEARLTAMHFGLDPQAAYQAGLLHDISVVIPNEERVAFQNELGKDVLSAERHLPLLLHQQQSAIIAQNCFGITDSAILSAIACHTTLKKGASDFDHCLFIADKIKWDRRQTPPYLKDVLAVLEEGELHKASLVYLDWLFHHDIQVIHPWALAAKRQLAIPLKTIKS